MKYFTKSTYTAEELKKEFRAHCMKLHPDQGGNAEEFRAMMTEYNQLAATMGISKPGRQQETTADYMRRKWAEHQAQEQQRKEEAEQERRRREAERRAEEAREAEELRRRQEIAAAAVRAWSGKLERIPDEIKAKRSAFGFWSDKKAAAQHLAITKRNIKAVINHYFPGLRVNVSISSRRYSEDFTISWEDGPNEKTLCNTCHELNFFIPSEYHSAGPCDDYGHWSSCKETAPWREAYGQAAGDTTNFKTYRTLSDEGAQQVEELARIHFANYNPNQNFLVTLAELAELAKANGFFDIDKMPRIFSAITNNYNDQFGSWDTITGETSRRSILEVLREWVLINIDEKAKAAKKAGEFSPKLGEALRTLRNLTGVNAADPDGANCFFCDESTTRYSHEWRRLTIAEALALLEEGEAVKFGTESVYDDGRRSYWGKDCGGYKTQQKRNEKYKAAGLIIDAILEVHAFVTLFGITAEFAAAIRAELADIDRQRAEWEAKQANGSTSEKTADQSNENTDADEAPADGLNLEDIADGVAVTGDSRTTYRHRRAIKAHGAHWNKDAQQWQASGEDADRLRAWFAQRDNTTATAEPEQPTTEEQPADTTTDTPTSEKTDPRQDEQPTTEEQTTPDPEPAPEPDPQPQQATDPASQKTAPKPDPQPVSIYELFYIFEEQAKKSKIYFGADFRKGPRDYWKFQRYYDNGKINDCFLMFCAGWEASHQHTSPAA